MEKSLLQKIVYYLTLVIIALYLLIDLDSFAADDFDAIGLPRITTLVDYIILPLLVILTFWLFEKNKKKVAFFFGIYALVFSIYFILHIINADDLQYNLFLPNNFVFLLSDEAIYTITLLLQLVYIWVFYRLQVSEKALEKVVVCLSATTSLPILISNLLVFGESTYQGYTIDNIFSWFSLPFNATSHHPRMYATKFFFEEGNTIGILMFIILPLLYYFFYKNQNKFKKAFLAILIFIQSISMIILSTRIATYASALVPLVVFAAYVVLLILKKESWRWSFMFICLIMTAFCAFIIPFGPAYQNQLIDATDYGFLKQDDGKISEGKEIVLRDGEGLIKYSKEWRDFYVYMFEDYSYLIGVTPPVYYTYWYDYHHDPEFWVDLMFDYPLEERVNGRQIQTIFTHYKFDPLNPYQKALGMGYGTFMRGSILLERDFAQQYFSYGYVGFGLLMLPWLIYTVYLGIKLIMGYKKGYWNFLNVLLMMGVCVGFVSAYTSGHTLDELTTSMLIALFLAMLSRNMQVAKDE